MRVSANVLGGPLKLYATPARARETEQDISANYGDVDSPDSKTVSRAKSLKNLARNKQRRLTLPALLSPELGGKGCFLYKATPCIQICL